MTERKPPPTAAVHPGALAVYDKNLGCWRVSNPSSPLFSTMSMVATHFFDGQQWKAIYA